MAHTNIHDPLHVYSNRELPLTQLPVDNTIDYTPECNHAQESPEILLPWQLDETTSSTRVTRVSLSPLCKKRFGGAYFFSLLSGP